MFKPVVFVNMIKLYKKACLAELAMHKEKYEMIIILFVK